MTELEFPPMVKSTACECDVRLHDSSRGNSRLRYHTGQVPQYSHCKYCLCVWHQWWAVFETELAVIVAVFFRRLPSRFFVTLPFLLNYALIERKLKHACLFYQTVIVRFLTAGVLKFGFFILPKSWDSKNLSLQRSRRLLRMIPAFRLQTRHSDWRGS